MHANEILESRRVHYAKSNSRKEIGRTWNDKIARAAEARERAELRKQGRTFHYIDPVEFTNLFKKNFNNRKKRVISEQLHLLTQEFASQFSLWPSEWVEDAASDALIIAIKAISRFTLACQHLNAFLYFTKLIQREMHRSLRIEKDRCRGLAPHRRNRDDDDVSSSNFFHAVARRAA